MQYNRLKRDNFIDRRNHITVVKKKISRNVGIHLHDFFEIEFVLDGEGENMMNGVAYPIRRGSIFLLTPSDFHSISTLSEIELITIMFDDSLLSVDMIDALTAKSSDINISLPEGDISIAVAIADMLANESQAKDEYAGRLTKNLLECLIMTILRHTAVPALSGKKLSPLDKALHYIHLHFRESPSLSDVAILSGYTPNYFSKLFAERVGMSYSEYLNALKIDLAKTLLASSDRSSAEIAFSCGFGSISNFHRVFSQKCGISPLEYRKK